LEPRYRNKDTEQFADGKHVSNFDSFKDQAYRRLDILDAATSLVDLRNLRSNGFEKLKGDRDGQYSIKINEKWRICFNWSDEKSKPFNIEIVDYHR
jgi:proteic killer suppression protein